MKGHFIKEEYEKSKSKIIQMLGFIQLEYNKIIANYQECDIIKNSIPIRASKELSKNKQKQINSLMYELFSPSMIELAKMIDAGIIEWESVSKKIELEDIIKNKEKIRENTLELVYEAHEKMYFYKHIKYNLFFDFLMQMYLFFEKELGRYAQNELLIKGQYIFAILGEIESKFNFEINSKAKETINLYKNVINVYKHGYGDSFISITKTHPEILNYTEEYEEMSFVFKLDKLNIDDFFTAVKSVLDDINNNIKNIY